MITKTFVDSKSSEVQEALFKIGFTYFDGGVSIIKGAGARFLYIDWNLKRIKSCYYLSTFLKSEATELGFGELLKKIDEELYKIETEAEEFAFKPFDKVLVKDNLHDTWQIGIFEAEYPGDICPYKCLTPNDKFSFCIPYEGNEHLANRKE